MADEVGDEARGGPAVDLGRRAELLQAPLVEDGDAVGQRHRLLLVVGDVDEGRADLAVDLRQLDLEALAQLEVERAERLVEQQHRRPLDERARHRHALPLAAGELRGRALAELLEPDQGERLVDPPARLGLGDPIHAQPEADVVAHAHVREQRVGLEDRVDRALVRRQRVDLPAAQPDRALGRGDEAADQVQGRRLAAAGRARAGRRTRRPRWPDRDR